MAIDIGRIGYQAYLDQLGATHLPPWEKIGKTQQDAWRHAGVAILQYIKKEEESGDIG